MSYSIEYILYNNKEFKIFAYAKTLKKAQIMADGLKKLPHVTEVKEIKKVYK